MLLNIPLKLVKSKIFLPLFIICCLGFALRVYKLDSRSIWADEAFTLLNSTGHGRDADLLLNSQYNATGLRRVGPLPAERYLSFLRYNPNRGLRDVVISALTIDAHPPLFFFLMYLWIKCFSTALFSIRFLSVLLGIAAIICAFLFTAKLFGKKAGIFSSLFVAVSPFAVFYAREARPYSLVLTIALLSSYFLVRFKECEKDILPAGFILITTLGLYTHYFYALIFLAHTVYFIFFSGCGAREKNKFCLAFLISLFLFFPWALATLRFGYQLKAAGSLFTVPINIATVPEVILNKLILFFVVLDAKAAVYSILNIFLAACLFLFGRALFRFKKELTLPVILLLLPILFIALGALSVDSVILSRERYFTFAFTGLIPIVGYILSVNWGKRVRKILVIFFFLVLIINSLLVVNGLAWQNMLVSRVKNACLWIKQESQQDRIAVITFNRNAYVLPLAFYLDKEVIIAPVNNSAEWIDSFRQFSGKINSIFVVAPTFEGPNIYPIEKELSGINISDTGFMLKEKRDFGDDRIKVIKLIASQHPKK